MSDIWTVESSLAGGLEMCRGTDLVDLGVELEESGAERSRDRVCLLIKQGWPIRPEDSEEELGAEEGHAEAIAW
jgi:hypothetical protein